MALPTPDFVEIKNAGTIKAETVPYLSREEDITSLYKSFVVKPAREGSSLGVSLVHPGKGSLEEAMKEAVKYDNTLIVEAYIEGEEFSAAFFGGLRYGGGKIYFKDGTTKDIYWNGPSLGFDFGANVSKVFTLIYNLELDNLDQLFARIPDVEGTLYLAAGLAIKYQKKKGIIITPVRSGLGLRAGINLGYTKYTKKKSIIPF